MFGGTYETGSTVKERREGTRRNCFDSYFAKYLYISLALPVAGSSNRLTYRPWRARLCSPRRLSSHSSRTVPASAHHRSCHEIDVSSTTWLVCDGSHWSPPFAVKPVGRVFPPLQGHGVLVIANLRNGRKVDGETNVAARASFESGVMRYVGAGEVNHRPQTRREKPVSASGWKPWS